jgi:hypothetical protein
VTYAAVLNATSLQDLILAYLGVIVVTVPVLAGVVIVVIRYVGDVHKIWVETMRQSTIIQTEIQPKLEQLHREGKAAHDDIIKAVNGGTISGSPEVGGPLTSRIQSAEEKQ